MLNKLAPIRSSCLRPYDWIIPYGSLKPFIYGLAFNSLNKHDGSGTPPKNALVQLFKYSFCPDTIIFYKSYACFVMMAFINKNALKKWKRTIRKMKWAQRKRTTDQIYYHLINKLPRDRRSFSLSRQYRSTDFVYEHVLSTCIHKWRMENDAIAYGTC